MTKKELEKLKGLPQEIKVLEKELTGMEEQELVGLVYKDYKTGYPKVKAEPALSSARYWKQRTLLKNKIFQKEMLIDKFERWVETVPDADMRRLLRYIYLHGMSQKAAARAMGPEWSRDAIAQRLKRFFDKI